MKSFKVLISLALSLAIILSVGTVYAATYLGGGFFGHYLDKSTDIWVSDGTLTATQNADAIYNYMSKNNMYLNSGFEESDVVTNSSSKAFFPLTDGWSIDWSVDAFDFSISNEAHSGNNSLYIQLPEYVQKETESIKIVNTKDIITDSNVKGRMYGLNAEETYIVSYWVKGSAATRMWIRDIKDDGNVGNSITNADHNITAADGWKLFTAEFSPNKNGQIYAMLLYQCVEDVTTEAYVDDVSMQTKDDAIASVVAMIENLNINAQNATRAIDDINQWVSVLGAQNISNYEDFEAKLKQYASIGKYEYVDYNNLYNNPSFELSNEVNNPPRLDSYTEFTKSWLSSSEIRNSKTTLSITDDAHSGINALKIVKSDTTSSEIRIFNDIVNTELTDGKEKAATVGLDCEEKYIMSYWVKGNAEVNIQYRSGNSQGGASYIYSNNHKNSDTYEKWELVTLEIQPYIYTAADNKYGIWSNVFFSSNNTTINEYAIIDDIQLVTKKQAIANVEKMIDNLDMSSHNAARAIDDIEQWIAKLGKDKISNYDLFLLKKTGSVYNEDNLFMNSGFEASDTFTSGSYGWTQNNPKYFNTVITDDAHSGNNALLSTSIDGDLGGENMIRNPDIEKSANFKVSNDTYLLSFWAKGTATIRYASYTYNFEATKWNTPDRTPINQDVDDWTLYTAEITPVLIDGNYYIKWGIAPFDRTDGKYIGGLTAYLDDFQLVTKEQAIANVDKMIDDFAVLSTDDENYSSAKSDLEQWLSRIDNADLNLKYDIVLNEKYNIITPNEGYTNLVQGDYIASVALKGKGEVNRVYGDNITNITSFLTKLTDEYVTHRERITVGNQGTHYMGVQLTNSAAINTVDIKDFSLKRVGDVNESGEIDIRDMVRMAKGLNGTDTTVDELVADYDNSSRFNSDDIAAVRELVLNKDLLS